MREIKFRCWDKKNKKMFIPSMMSSCGAVLIEERHELGEGYWGTHPIEYPFEYILMQFTGLKDKNGKEIYEGDVVRDDSRDNGADFAASLRRGDYKVTWSKENCCFSLGGYYMQISRKQAARLKVIGNIYENPELLK